MQTIMGQDRVDKLKHEHFKELLNQSSIPKAPPGV
jgi:hypothetical protein